jgi:peptidoglycan/xylan/chitin deacetylase (PgdA/CDA1 family)
VVLNVTGSFVALMYHEIGVPGQPPCEPSPGYLRYVVPVDEFRKQLEILRDEGIRGCSIAELLDGRAAPGSAVAMTFDDGCQTDLNVAAPLLRDAMFGATFFVVPGFLGRPGYLTPEGVRSLAEQGFEIGSHGMTHRFLTALKPADLEEELSTSRRVLGEMAGAEVRHLSCPGGRWSQVVAERARADGYSSVSTSRIGRNDPVRDRYRLARLAVRRGTSTESFRRRCRGAGLTRERWRAALFATARRALGDALYDTLQRRLG